MSYFTPAIRAFSSNAPMGKLMRRLLAACVLIPILSDLLINFGAAGFGTVRSSSVHLIHVIVLTLILAAIVIEVGRALQQIDDGRRRTHERLQLQIDSMPIPCITTGIDRTISSWNSAAERVFGHSAAEVIGQPAARIFLPAGVVSDAMEALLSGNAPSTAVNENITKDGRTILCRWSNTPLRGNSGEVVGILSMIEDITEVQRAARDLRHSEQRHRDLIDSLPHYIFSVDNEDRYLAVNLAACQAFGRPEEDIIGRTAVELGIAPNLAREWTEQNATTRARRALQTLETTMPIHGVIHHTHCITSPMLDAAGAVVGVTGISIDTTEEKLAKATTRQLLRAIEQLDEVIFITDRDGVITYVNPAFEKVYGYRPDETIGQTPRILKSGELSAEEYGQLWSELLAGRSNRTEYRNRRKDGSLVEVISTASPVVDEDGSIAGFIAVQQDNTEQKHAQQERRKLDARLSNLGKMEALGTLAGGIAHDFNNILSIIITHADLLERQSTPGRAAQAIATIKQAVKRGATLSRQILTFARRAEIKAEPIDVTPLLLELGSMISETIPRTIRFELQAEPDLPRIVADSGQLHQALLNLCLNACDAMPGGGNLRIESRLMAAKVMKLLFSEAKDTDYVRIVIADDGSGMDEETRRRIFEPFFTTKQQGKGTGLGLAVAYGVVKSHDGLIEVESELGRGTEFRLYFPVGIAAANASSESHSVVRGGRETLLIVEDEPALREALLIHLRESGYQTHAASHGAEAMEICRGLGAPDAVIMDLGMPGMTADELVTALRQAAPTTPILAMTGYVDPVMHDRLITAGVERLLQKPFAMDELLGSVRLLLDHERLSGAKHAP